MENEPQRIKETIHEPLLIFHVKCMEPKQITLFAVENFLYDFNTTYEILRLAYDPSFFGIVNWDRALYRDGRPLPTGDRLLLHRLRYESPLDLVLWIKAGLETIIALGKLADILNRVRQQKTGAPLKSLDDQLAEIQSKIAKRNRTVDALNQLTVGHLPVEQPAQTQLLEPVYDNGADSLLGLLEGRLRESPLVPETITLEFEEPLLDSTAETVKTLINQALTEAKEIIASGLVPKDVAAQLYDAVVDAARNPSIESLLYLRKEIGQNSMRW